MKRLGEGTGGEVWQAHDDELDRLVAVKIMKKADRPSSRALEERFRREAALPSAVQHAGITVVYDAGVDHGADGDERRFIVTELLVGSNLGEVLKRHPEGMPTEQVIDLCIQLSDALAAAHAGNLIHRDLKPSNLFVLSSGRLKICDFGIAGDTSLEGIDPRLTEKGLILGTPFYMSPEQWDGSAARPSMDLYAMGCLLYEMLTGQVPFESNSKEILKRKHHEDKPIPPRALKSSVPEALSSLTLKLLAKDPADRPEGAQAVATELQDLREARNRAEIEAKKDDAVKEAVSREQDAARAEVDKVKRTAEAAVKDAEARASEAQAAAARARSDLAAARDRAAKAETVRRRPTLPTGSSSVQVTIALASASLSVGHVEVFMHNGSAALRHLTRHGEAWEARPGIGLPEGQVSVIAAGYDRRHVRVILAVADGTLYLKQWWQEDREWNCWADWSDLRWGGQDVPAGVRDAAIASPAAGQLDVFALNADGRIYHSWRGSARGRDRSWSPWQVIGDAPEASAIAAASYKEHCLALVAATDDGVQVNSWASRDRWEGWSRLSRSAATDVAYSSSRPGQADCFTLDADGTIAHRAWSSQEKKWTHWRTGMPGPGATITAITAMAPAGQPPGLAALTSDGIAHYTDVPPNDRNPEWHPLLPLARYTRGVIKLLKGTGLNDGRDRTHDR